MSVLNMTCNDLKKYEERCRPDKDSRKNTNIGLARNLYGIDLYSDAGFISDDDVLFDVITTDHQYIKNTLGEDGHNIIAKTVFRALCRLSDDEIKEKMTNLFILMNKSNFKVDASEYLGAQVCPFADYNTLKCHNCVLPNRANMDFVITKLSNGDKLKISSLMPHLYYDHHFFEGNVPNRIEPSRLIDFFELI